MKSRFVILLFLVMLSSSLYAQKNTVDSTNMNKPAKVTLKQENGKYTLYVNGNPFYIKGAGLEFGNIELVALHGGNSIRTWRTSNGKRTGKELLDEAYRNGIMVTMGIDVKKERHGFDYNNEEAVKKQLEDIKQQVLELKDHPALLMWGIGNELNLRYTNPKVWDAVNDISKMIHEIDPNHLTTTMLAGVGKQEVAYIKEKSTDLDLLSFQIYGRLGELPELVKESGWEGAYMVTEWGATGHWEVPLTSWGVPIEENTTVKAANYLKRYKNGIAANPNQCIGSYVFLWGQKQERTPTWYGIFLEDGSETEAVDVMHFLWTNSWPKNRSPQVISFKLNKKTAYDNVIVKADSEILAEIVINDFEKDTLNYNWEIMYESTDLKDGGDYEEKPNNVAIEIVNKSEGTFVFKAPKEKGNYRIFGYVTDGNNHTATANIPFQVE